MRNEIARALVAAFTALGILVALNYGQGSISLGIPTIRPEPAQVPRAAPMTEIVVGKQTPLPRPANGP